MIRKKPNIVAALCFLAFGGHGAYAQNEETKSSGGDLEQTADLQLGEQDDSSFSVSSITFPRYAGDNVSPSENISSGLAFKKDDFLSALKTQSTDGNFAVDGLNSPGLFKAEAYRLITGDTFLGGDNKASAGGQMAVMGRDDRREVSAGQSDRRIGQLLMTFPDGGMSTCSGTLITPTHVLTAAHCIADTDNGGIINGPIAFAPGRTRSGDPIGHYYAKRAFIMKFYDTETRKQLADFRAGRSRVKNQYNLVNAMSDLAIVELERAPANGSIGHFGVKPTPPAANSLMLVGYPGDKDRKTKWRSSCDYILSPNKLLVLHNCDTYGGMSGGPTITSSDPNVITSVLSGGPAENQPFRAVSRNRPLSSYNLSHNLKAGNIFRWDQSPNSAWQDRELGVFDWLAVWINWDNLPGILPNDWSDNSKRQAISTLRQLTVSRRFTDKSQHRNFIEVNSRCSADIWFAAEMTRNNQTNAEGWWKITSGETLHLSTQRGWFAYYADDEDSGGAWSGDRRRTVRGKTVGMRYREIGAQYGYGTYELNLKC